MYAARAAGIVHAAMLAYLLPLTAGGLLAPFVLGDDVRRLLLPLLGIFVTSTLIVIVWAVVWLWLARGVGRRRSGMVEAVLIMGLSEVVVAGTGFWVFPATVPGARIVLVVLGLMGGLTAVPAALAMRGGGVSDPAASRETQARLRAQRAVAVLLVLQVATLVMSTWFLVSVPKDEPEGDGFATGLAWFVVLVVGLPLSLVAIVVWGVLLRGIRARRPWWPALAQVAGILTVALGALMATGVIGIPWLILGIWLLYVVSDWRRSLADPAGAAVPT